MNVQAMIHSEIRSVSSIDFRCYIPTRNVTIKINRNENNDTRVRREALSKFGFESKHLVDLFPHSFWEKNIFFRNGEVFVMKCCTVYYALQKISVFNARVKHFMIKLLMMNSENNGLFCRYVESLMKMNRVDFHSIIRTSENCY